MHTAGISRTKNPGAKVSTRKMEENTISSWRTCTSVAFLWLSVVMTEYCVHGAPRCPQGQTFFDELTNRRECCYDICQGNVELADMCKLKCPGFILPTSSTPPTDCPPGGSYLNVSTNQEVCCADLCNNRDIAEIKILCPECPPYGARIGEEQPVDIDHQSGGLITPIVVACVAACVMITILVAIVYLYRKKICQHLYKNNFRDSDSNMSDTQERETLSEKTEKQDVEKQMVTEVSKLNETSSDVV